MERQIPVQRLSTLIEAVASLVGMTDLEALLRRLVETACDTTGARYAALGVVGEHKTLVEFVQQGIDEETVAKIGHLPKGHGVLGTLIRDRKTLLLDHISDHPDSVGFPEHHPQMEVFLGVPVGTGESAIGNLYLTEKEGGFDDDDRLIVEALAAIAAVAVETTRLRSRLEEIAVVEDRQRIGRDLHDSIIQDMFGTGLQLQGLASGAVDESTRIGLGEAVARIDETIDSLRQIVTALDKPEESGTFGESLRTHLARLARPYQTAIRVVVEPSGARFGASMVESIQPMITEAVSNALRHSGSDVIDVRVEQLGGRLVVSVVDQGTGFDPENVEAGMGLKNLSSRAVSLGGHVEIRSIPGVGTVVEILMPYSG
ncbi:MAG: GAF domain-containing protein [Acidimicrobiia bacterium]|nr:GAF domain-containing protein [Acidimicrobiia bacterium]